MINIDDFIKNLRKNDLNFASGVPDSLLKDLCFEFDKNFKLNHVVAANEGSALSLGIGYYLKTKKIPLIYLQNSGLGNMVNPILSLADDNVFNIPLFIIMGWRGERSKIYKDEPQHISQGYLTEFFLDKLKIKYNIISQNSNYQKIIKNLKNHAKSKNKIVCLLIRKNVFEKKTSPKKEKLIDNKLMKREDILKFIIKYLPKNLTSVSTTGIVSREIYEILKKNKKINNLMCVGGMGHAISLATGVALKSKKKILCFDGDGAITMHLGSLATSSKLNNIVHVVFNNKSHESVGGHDTSSKHVKFYKLAKNLGYKKSYITKNNKQALNLILKALKSNCSNFIEILCKKGHRDNISRPSEKMTLLKKQFMKKI